MSHWATWPLYTGRMSENLKTVAKLVMIDAQDQYLMMWRSDHPTFGTDPDLPGGTREDGESALETMLREVVEEAGVVVDESLVQEIYNGIDYSEHESGNQNVLYAARFEKRPDIVMSWEHSSYKWLPKDEFIKAAKAANDTYMHMVGDTIQA